MFAECAQFWWGLPLSKKSLACITLLLSQDHVSKMQLNNVQRRRSASDTGEDIHLTLLSHFRPFPPPVPSVSVPSLPSLSPNSYASRIPCPRTTKRSSSRMGPGQRSRLPSGSGRSPAAKRISVHFNSKFPPFGIATDSLFGSRSPNCHSVFGRDKVIGISTSPNLETTCLAVPTILLAVPNWTRIHKMRDVNF